MLPMFIGLKYTTKLISAMSVVVAFPCSQCFSSILNTLMLVLVGQNRPLKKVKGDRCTHYIGGFGYMSNFIFFAQLLLGSSLFVHVLLHLRRWRIKKLAVRSYVHN
jgi:hypothetical protein